jgi:hypothetical protein
MLVGQDGFEFGDIFVRNKILMSVIYLVVGFLVSIPIMGDSCGDKTTSGTDHFVNPSANPQLLPPSVNPEGFEPGRNHGRGGGSQSNFE